LTREGNSETVFHAGELDKGLSAGGAGGQEHEGEGDDEGVTHQTTSGERSTRRFEHRKKSNVHWRINRGETSGSENTRSEDAPGGKARGGHTKGRQTEDGHACGRFAIAAP
jgi:hypothetical protein